MKYISIKYVMQAQITVAFIAAFMFMNPTGVHGQNTSEFENKWLNIGSFQHYYGAGGAEPVSGMPGGYHGLQWPGLTGKRQHSVMKGFWVGVEDFTDQEDRYFPYKVTHVGPRDFGDGQHVSVNYQLVSKYEPTDVTVDGLQSFQEYAHVDSVDPSMMADRKIIMRMNTQTGITVDKVVRAFRQDYHDNYHITEYTFTNTGNVDADPEIELPNQTLTGARFFFIDAYYINRQAGQHVPGGSAWGKNLMNDIVGDGMEDYNVDFTALFSWHGYEPSFTEFNNIGAPIVRNGPSLTAEEDTVGRLGASEFIGKVSIHADRSADDTSPASDQPSMTGYIDQDDKITTNPDAFNKEQMAVEYEFMSQGHMYPHHADVVEAPQEGESWQKRMAEGTNDPSQGRPGGWKNAFGYGPYHLDPGDDVHIVVAEAANGLSEEANLDIGRAYKASGFDDDQIIAFDADGDGSIEDDERMTKNRWVMTSRDSLFKSFRRAIANHEAGYALPEPPPPPQAFEVNSGPNSISLSWVPASEAPDHYEVWRARGRLGAEYEKIAEVPSGATTYEDDTAIRGIDYYYYLQAVGSPSANSGAVMTPPGALKSGRYYTQTYDPASLRRPPGDGIREAHIVPNPYNLGSGQDVRWPDQDNKIGFLDIPGQCTIRIYTELGELVETIEHTDGSGDEYWDLTTSSNQIAVSGVYLVLIRDHNTGESIKKTMVIIR